MRARSAMGRNLATVVAAAALALAACGGGDSVPATTQAATTTRASTTTIVVQVGGAANGQTLFLGTCAACHGQDAMGVEGLGKQLSTSEFIAGRSDQEMVAFIIVGRPPDDDENTTGIAMLPRGGNPALTDADLLDIVAFLRSLQ